LRRPLDFLAVLLAAWGLSGVPAQAADVQVQLDEDIDGEAAKDESGYAVGHDPKVCAQWTGAVRPRHRSRILSTIAVVSAVVILSPTAFADSDSIRFDFDPDNPSAEHEWTVPDGVTEVTVEAAGGGGGGADNLLGDFETSGGKGALVTATISSTPGEKFVIGVGGAGSGHLGFSGGGGGGGASIITATDVLVIAGGGGGAGLGDTGLGADGGGGGGEGGGGGDGEASDDLYYGGGGSAGDAGKNNGLSKYNGTDYHADTAEDGAGYGGAQVGGAGSAWDAEPGGGGWGGAGYGGGAAGNDRLGASGGGGAGGSTAQGGEVDLDSVRYSADGGSGGFGYSAGGAGWVVITWVIPSPSPDPETASGGILVPRDPVVLTLTMPAGLTCSAPTSDASGAWIQLPTANDCSDNDPDAGRSGEATGLLGWATTPDFPVDIAQRQVDNGWGAYERLDESGALTAVFIPAGGWTQASSDTSLFPIWEN